LRLLAIQGLVAEAADEDDMGFLPDFDEMMGPGSPEAELPDLSDLGLGGSVEIGESGSQGAPDKKEVSYSFDEDSSDDEGDGYERKEQNVMDMLKSAQTIEDLFEMLHGKEADDIFEVLEYDNIETLIEGLTDGSDLNLVRNLTQGEINVENGADLGRQLQTMLDAANEAAKALAAEVEAAAKAQIDSKLMPAPLTIPKIREPRGHCLIQGHCKKLKVVLVKTPTIVKVADKGKFVVAQWSNVSQRTCDMYAERCNESCEHDPKNPDGNNHIGRTFKPYTGEVRIKGVVQVGRELTADTSAIRNSDGSIPSFTYQWTRGNNVAVGDNLPTYTLDPSDANQNIKVTVTYELTNPTYIKRDEHFDGDSFVRPNPVVKTSATRRSPVKGSGKRKADGPMTGSLAKKQNQDMQMQPMHGLANRSTILLTPPSASTLKQKSFLKANQV